MNLATKKIIIEKLFHILCLSSHNNNMRMVWKMKIYAIKTCFFIFSGRFVRKCQENNFPVSFASVMRKDFLLLYCSLSSKFLLYAIFSSSSYWVLYAHNLLCSCKICFSIRKILHRKKIAMFLKKYLDLVGIIEDDRKKCKRDLKCFKIPIEIF